MEQLTYEGCFDFVNGNKVGDDYSYNENGALSKDLNKKILSIEYDFLGNPKTITLTQRRSIEYVYSADGRRLRAIHKTGTISEKTDYIGNLILKGGKPEMYRFAGGYASFEADTIAGYHYYITDYLGNNRMVVNASTDAVEQENHYYSYGGLIGDLSTNEGLQEYKFVDKKLDRTYGLDLYDVEARQYDAIAPWFTCIDPLAEKYYSISPYAYCAGDPVNLIDPTGMYTYTINPKTGKIVQSGDLGDYDEVKIEGSSQDPLRVNHVEGKSILDGLQGEGDGNTTSVSSTSDQLIDVFLYVASNENMDIEWSLQIGTKGNKETFALGTSGRYNAVDAPKIEKDQSLSDIWLKMHFHPDPKHGTKGGSPEDISIFKNIYNDQPSASAPLHLVCNNNMVYLYNGYLQSIPGLERPASKFKATLRGYKGYYELQKKYNYVHYGKPKK